jgi:hypothetical protein
MVQLRGGGGGADRSMFATMPQCGGGLEASGAKTGGGLVLAGRVTRVVAWVIGRSR